MDSGKVGRGLGLAVRVQCLGKKGREFQEIRNPRSMGSQFLRA